MKSYCPLLAIHLLFLLNLFSWAVPGRTSLRDGAWQNCIPSLSAKLQEELDTTLWFWGGNIIHETFLSSSTFCPVFIGLFLFNHSLPFALYYVIASGRLCGFLGRDETGFFCLKAYLRENALVRYSFYMCRTRTFLHKAFEILDLRCALMVALSLLSMLGIGLNTNIKTCVKSVSYLCPYCTFLQLPYPFCPLNAKISFHCLWNILLHSHISGYRLVGCYMLLFCGPGLMGYCNTSTLKLIKP